MQEFLLTSKLLYRENRRGGEFNEIIFLFCMSSCFSAGKYLEKIGISILSVFFLKWCVIILQSRFSIVKIDLIDLIDEYKEIINEKN